jgi:hypothetical protein
LRLLDPSRQVVDVACIEKADAFPALHFAQDKLGRLGSPAIVGGAEGKGILKFIWLLHNRIALASGKLFPLWQGLAAILLRRWLKLPDGQFRDPQDLGDLGREFHVPA